MASSGDTAGDASSASLDTTNGDATSTGDSGSAGTTDGGSETSGETEDGQVSVCDPQPLPVNVEFTLATGEGREVTSLQTEETCEVVDLLSVPSVNPEIRLSCASEVYDLVLRLDGPVALDVGDEVSFTADIGGEPWQGSHLSIRRDGILILAVTVADVVPGEASEHAPDPAFLAPVAIEVLTDVCDAEPGVDGSFLDACTVDRRLALRFTNESGEATVYDSGAGTLGELRLLVDVAMENVPKDAQCDDVVPRWFSFAVLRQR